MCHFMACVSLGVYPNWCCTCVNTECVPSSVMFLSALSQIVYSYMRCPLIDGALVRKVPPSGWWCALRRCALMDDFFLQDVPICEWCFLAECDLHGSCLIKGGVILRGMFPYRRKTQQEMSFKDRIWSLIGCGPLRVVSLTGNVST